MFTPRDLVSLDPVARTVPAAGRHKMGPTGRQSTKSFARGLPDVGLLEPVVAKLAEPSSYVVGIEVD
jgi:hypothetical protein